MKKVIRLTESDLTRIVKRVIIEQSNTCGECVIQAAKSAGIDNITEEKMTKLINLLSSGKKPELKDITPLLPDFTEIMKGGKFLMGLVDCMDKCNVNMDL